MKFAYLNTPVAQVAPCRCQNTEDFLQLFFSCPGEFGLSPLLLWFTYSLKLYVMLEKNWVIVNFFLQYLEP